jgi:glycosyltransferase involved in cell wall biosynthesis
LPDEYLGLPVDGRREQAFGFCGTWIKRKGVESIQAEIPEVLKAAPDWRFKVIGVGDQWDPRRHFPEDVVGRIDVIPFADRSSTLRDTYQRLAILLMPSLYEGFGLVAAEAMACGCAVISAPTGLGASLIHDREALVLGRPGCDSLGEGLTRLIRDFDLRERVAAGGYRRVQSLRWDDAIRTLDLHYRRWAAESPGR